MAGKTHLQDGFRGDRRIRPAQFFQLDVGLPDRNFIHLWLPETVSAGGETRFFAPRGEVGGEWEIDPEGAVHCCRELGSDLWMESVVAEVELGVRLTIRLSNRSDQWLRGVTAQTCVQLPAAPDLRDVALERTFWRGQGRWQRFAITGRPQEGRCLFYSHDGPVDLPLVVVASGTGPYAAGLVFRGATSVSGNCQGAIACMHSSVPGADLPPGGMLSLKGFLILHPEGLDGALAAAQTFLAEGDS
ncbi:MAG: hypothetical protein WDA75_04250 [Candidatus Latescibacterota bacterium]|jgi:hypothetical protein